MAFAIEAFLLCDKLSNEQGKISLHGVITRLAASSFPVVYRECFFYVQGQPSETEKIEIGIDLVHPDGARTVVWRDEASVHAGKGVIFTLRENDLELAAPGPHRFVFLYDGQDVSVLNVIVSEMSGTTPGVRTH